MEVFLKETITGIILLGAAGSVLASSVLWGVNKLIKFFAPKLYKFVLSAAARVALFSISPGIDSQVKLYIDNNPNKLDAYYSSQKSKIIVILTISTWLLMWLLVRVKVDSVELYSFEAIFYISLFFLLFGLAIRNQLSLMVPLLIDIDDIIEDKLKR